MISSPRGPTSPITIALFAAARFAIFTPSVITFFNLLDDIFIGLAVNVLVRITSEPASIYAL
ncbi:hypothetical protein ES703_100943 [subsurface metagenome]